MFGSIGAKLALAAVATAAAVMAVSLAVRVPDDPSPGEQAAGAMPAPPPADTAPAPSEAASAAPPQPTIAPEPETEPDTTADASGAQEPQPRPAPADDERQPEAPSTADAEVPAPPDAAVTPRPATARDEPEAEPATTPGASAAGLAAPTAEAPPPERGRTGDEARSAAAGAAALLPPDRPPAAVIAPVVPGLDDVPPLEAVDEPETPDGGAALVTREAPAAQVVPPPEAPPAAAVQPPVAPEATPEATQAPAATTDTSPTPLAGTVTGDGDLVEVEALIALLGEQLLAPAEADLVPPEVPLAALEAEEAAPMPLAAPPRSGVLVRPSFDLVRIAADGTAVIAGRASPGAHVELRLDGRVIDRVRADRRGEWVAVPQRPIGPGSQELSLATEDALSGVVESDQVVMLAMPGAVEAAAVVDAGKAGAADEGSAVPLAVLLPRDGGGQTRLLQAPGGLRGGGDLELQAIDYDEQGALRLMGQATPGATLRVLVNGEVLVEVLADDRGSWMAALDQRVRPGDHALRVDQLGDAGRTVARVETPLRREAVLPRESHGVDYVIVQPGNSLWRIARRLLGDGLRYQVLYQANRELIADPDLIFPGQVFRVPSPEPSRG